MGYKVINRVELHDFFKTCRNTLHDLLLMPMVILHPSGGDFLIYAATVFSDFESLLC